MLKIGEGLMLLTFNSEIADGYKSNAQRARVLTENWVATHTFCPVCGKPSLSQYGANRPVADFYCDDCLSEYELKSKDNKTGTVSSKVPDGAYETMISRITSLNNPNFFFLAYYNNAVNNFLMIPNYFFTPAIVEKRKPLSNNARRAGWVGCNINISGIPEIGRIFIVKNSIAISKDSVIGRYQKARRLETKNVESRGWLLDVLSCVDKIPDNEFSLAQVYSFESELAAKYPNNNNIRAKIRQQLQMLRDRGFVEFSNRGIYRKL